MSATWLAGAQIQPATHAGGEYDPSFPWRVVLHSTEGVSAEGAEGAYRGTGSWPHLTVDPGRRRIAQHYPLEVAARALEHPGGTPPTNGARAIQVEIVGDAVDMPDMPAADLAWLGDAVLRPLLAWTGAPAAAVAHWPGYPASYGLHAGQRMTDAEWRAFSGVCGHMHVPHNDHGDPGAIDIVALLGTDDHPQEENVIAHFVKLANQPQVWLGGLATGPRAVDSFASAEFVAAQQQVIIGAVPPGAGKDVQDSHGALRSVWVVALGDAGLFGLPIE